MSQTGTVRSDLWRVIHTERAALVDDLAGLTPEQWAKPSLCGGWNVHDVVAHLAATATVSCPDSPRSFCWPDSVPAASSTNKSQRDAGKTPHKLCLLYDLRSPAQSLPRSRPSQGLSKSSSTVKTSDDRCTSGMTTQQPISLKRSTI